ncbi:penicillin-binding protein 2 [Methylococcus sp. EFPC2]|uniref:penicillin-binding protein 2 n=1 Tax=Methylococcus sp. EFPC2 TaxID=2812648 RepID=UPI0019682761|nr:penicillin-binding protein 2 [Methylococcus sp. EFPC2]QSA96136.1 penicillin-binding protein 2 [Methylococcus sp. EFPC2]
MNLDFNPKDRFYENRLFLNRIVASVIFIVLATAGLVLRLVYLQVVGHEHYATLSRDNWVKIAPLPPTRGMIYDRNGEVLADNIPTYSLEIIPDRTSDLNATLAELKTLLNVSDEEIARFHALRHRRKTFESVPLRLQLSEEEIARFSVRMPHFPGVEVKARLLRTYPYGELTAHVVGYVGRISEAELQQLDPSVYSGTYHIGKNGVEKAYESVLHGKTGYEELETNVEGRSINVIGQNEPQSGADLHLSLDIKMQKIAYDALGDYNGAVVALDPATGQVLALVSKPSFDPNPFIQGIRRADYEALQASPDRPLYNRVLRGIYPPGSTVKPFMALAGLETGQIGAGGRIFCPGYFRLPGSSHKYRDWTKFGHGSVDMQSAITQSCDVYFYQLALQLGIDRMHDFMQRFGFGRETGVDLDGEKPGLYPSPEWKRKYRKQPWFAGETVIAGIGQGYVSVTPMQLARAVASLANQGRLVTPRLVAKMDAPPGVENPHPPVKGENLHISPNNWHTVVDAMTDVVHSQRGTAKLIAPGLAYRVAGKTGTAQVFSVRQDQDYKRMRVKDKLKDHAWFIAFAPAEAPRIAVVALAENGSHGGSVAAPIARKLMDYYLNGHDGSSSP